MNRVIEIKIWPGKGFFCHVHNIILKYSEVLG